MGLVHGRCRCSSNAYVQVCVCVGWCLGICRHEMCVVALVVGFGWIQSVGSVREGNINSVLFPFSPEPSTHAKILRRNISIKEELIKVEYFKCLPIID